MVKVVSPFDMPESINIGSTRELITDRQMRLRVERAQRNQELISLIAEREASDPDLSWSVREVDGKYRVTVKVR